MKEALKLALEAWKNAAIRLGEELSSVGPDGYYDMTAQQWLDWAMEQEPRGKNSLAQPEQEPVAWEQFYPDIGKPQLKQEPVGFMNAGHVHEMQQGRLPYGYMYPKGGIGADIAVYTTPPKRPWAGLTDEFCITEVIDVGQYSLQIIFKSRKNADEFKAALKEKNT